MRLLIIGNPCTEVTAAAGMAADRGAQVRHRRTVEEAMQELRAGQGADLLFVDVRQDVPELVAALRREHIHLPVVAFGINAEPAHAVAAIKGGAVDFVSLPPDPKVIALIFETLGAEPRQLVCVDPRMQEVLSLARQFAPSDASVLITGESGTGKEVMARFVHRHSRRAKGAFVSVNCAAIPDNLLESELFGHEKGAFTGALNRRVGKFEEADGGTLLLDEVSEMDIRLQAKLLRALQEREIDRVGGNQPVKVDLRIIATSNRDLEASVAEGRFREDLYFRLNVVNLHLPPLRERPGDVAALALHFIEKYSGLNGLPVSGLTSEARGLLTRYPWRGNVRELENCMHRAVLLARAGAVGQDAIMLKQKPQASPVLEPAPGSASGSAPLVGKTVAGVERDLILETLQHTSGNRTHAAAMLGISIRTLRNKLKEYLDQGVRIPAHPPEPPRPYAA
jgi:two-component system, response regulator FlrC